MVICDGFNVPLQQLQANNSQNEQTTNNTNGIKVSSFPKPPPQPPARTFIPAPIQPVEQNGNHKLNGNGLNHSDNSKKQPIIIPTKLPLTQSTSNCNYDNLRNIDSDDSRLTSPDVVNNYLFNNSTPVTVTPKMPSSQSFTNNKVKPTPPPVNPTAITDKNIMNNIMNKCNIDTKSQSMMTTPTIDSSITGNSVHIV